MTAKRVHIADIIFFYGLMLTIPLTSVAGPTHYNLSGYLSPLTERVTIPAQWMPTQGAENYTGKLDATWSAILTSNSDQVVISKASAIALGAPRDFTLGTGPDNCWGMLMNFGLLNLNQDADLVVTLIADSSEQSSLAPAFALYQGWDMGQNSSRHQTITFGPDNPLGTQGLRFLGDAYANNQTPYVQKTFSNLSAGRYELFVTNRSNSGAYGGYVVNLQTFNSGSAPRINPREEALFGPANNQKSTGEPTDGLCLYGRSTLMTRKLPDGRYVWSCGDERTEYPSQMCYSLSDRNIKKNQGPITLHPGRVEVPANTKVIESLAGGSGIGKVRYVLEGESQGLNCRVTQKGRNVLISSGKGKTGTCLIYAKKSADARFNDVRSVTYSITFSKN